MSKASIFFCHGLQRVIQKFKSQSSQYELFLRQILAHPVLFMPTPFIHQCCHCEPVFWHPICLTVQEGCSTSEDPTDWGVNEQENPDLVKLCKSGNIP